MSKIIEVSIKKKVNCSKDVAFWNYWDHEHLDVVHKGYKKSDIMYDSKNFLFRFDDIRIPGLSFLTTNSKLKNKFPLKRKIGNKMKNFFLSFIFVSWFLNLLLFKLTNMDL